MPQDRYQTVQEIAERLKVSEASHWIKEGALRAIDIGKGWRISDADLDEFLRQHETRPRSTLPVEINPADPSDRRER